MNASTLVLAFGAGLFMVPIPGTFVSGGLVMLAGLVARGLGSGVTGSNPPERQAAE